MLHKRTKKRCAIGEVCFICIKNVFYRLYLMDLGKGRNQQIENLGTTNTE